MYGRVRVRDEEDQVDVLPLLRAEVHQQGPDGGLDVADTLAGDRGDADAEAGVGLLQPWWSRPGQWQGGAVDRAVPGCSHGVDVSDEVCSLCSPEAGVPGLVSAAGVEEEGGRVAEAVGSAVLEEQQVAEHEGRQQVAQRPSRRDQGAAEGQQPGERPHCIIIYLLLLAASLESLPRSAGRDVRLVISQVTRESRKFSLSRSFIFICRAEFHSKELELCNWLVSISTVCIILSREYKTRISPSIHVEDGLRSLETARYRAILSPHPLLPGSDTSYDGLPVSEFWVVNPPSR